jgi:hypothetical protein
LRLTVSQSVRLGVESPDICCSQDSCGFFCHVQRIGLSCKRSQSLSMLAIYESVSKSFRTESITK